MKALNTDNQIRTEKGATIMEAMLVLPILFSTVFFIVWYSRVMHESNMMNEAMYRAGKVASTVPNLDIDLNSAGQSQDPNAVGVRQELKEFRRVRKANEYVKEAGVNFLKSVGFLKDANEEELLTLTKQIKRATPAVVSDVASYSFTLDGKMLSLLPGECASFESQVGGKSTTKYTCNNKVLNLGYSDDTPMTAQEKQNLQPAKVLLKQFPIKVVAIADLESSIFHGGGTEKEFNFYVVREPIPAGPFSEVVEVGELRNGSVGSGGLLEPLKYGVGADEGGVVAGCGRDSAWLVRKSTIVGTFCYLKIVTYIRPYVVEPGNIWGFCKTECN